MATPMDIQHTLDMSLDDIIKQKQTSFKRPKSAPASGAKARPAGARAPTSTAGAAKKAPAKRAGSKPAGKAGGRPVPKVLLKKAGGVAAAKAARLAPKKLGVNKAAAGVKKAKAAPKVLTVVRGREGRLTPKSVVGKKPVPGRPAAAPQRAVSAKQKVAQAVKNRALAKKRPASVPAPAGGRNSSNNNASANAANSATAAAAEVARAAAEVARAAALLSKARSVPQAAGAQVANSMRVLSGAVAGLSAGPLSMSQRLKQQRPQVAAPGNLQQRIGGARLLPLPLYQPRPVQSIGGLRNDSVFSRLQGVRKPPVQRAPKALPPAGRPAKGQTFSNGHQAAQNRPAPRQVQQPQQRQRPQAVAPQQRRAPLQQQQRLQQQQDRKQQQKQWQQQQPDIGLQYAVARKAKKQGGGRPGKQQQRQVVKRGRGSFTY